MMMSKNYRVIDIISVVLLLIGGLNWGFIGFFGWDVLASIFGEMSVVTRAVYCLVGLAAVWRLVCWAMCKHK